MFRAYLLTKIICLAATTLFIGYAVCTHTDLWCKQATCLLCKWSFYSVFSFCFTDLICFCLLKGRLNELVSQIRLQRQLTTSRADAHYQVDPLMMEEVKQVSYPSVLVIKLCTPFVKFLMLPCGNDIKDGVDVTILRRRYIYSNFLISQGNTWTTVAIVVTPLWSCLHHIPSLSKIIFGLSPFMHMLSQILVRLP